MTPSSTPPPHLAALLRHFADLRDGTHGHPPAVSAHTREDKELLFLRTVPLLDPYARQALAEINTHLLLDAGLTSATGVRRTLERGLDALWELSWPAQRDTGLSPVRLRAFYGAGFHHPHLQGGTVGQWPLNVFTPEQAAAELPTLRAIATADLHNLVYQSGHRIIPALRGER
ncbi:hypothetical protein FXF51_46550 [Nonomuraea sp. PA05]|uniref:hypothetical protein n=1 Tax=Nonomuraea sp. PA05 TaxID=2604466 RepID=UPI0011DA0310|nr:hypothetical protein [Nonomuraea sp. PA05]TYB54715.1 hypothetical protein FXF51_46550 [Nonomuraea sp. PA05]